MRSSFINANWTMMQPCLVRSGFCGAPLPNPSCGLSPIFLRDRFRGRESQVFVSNSVRSIVQKSIMKERLPTCVLVMLLAFVPFVPVASANSSWKPCSSTEDYKVTVTDVKVNPDPVVRGGDATFTIPALTSEVITGGTVTVQVYFLGVPVHTEKDDLCAKASCPIAPGEFLLKNSEGLPDFTPTGSYRLDMHIEDEDGGVLSCLKINFRIAAPSVQVE